MHWNHIQALIALSCMNDVNTAFLSDLNIGPVTTETLLNVKRSGNGSISARKNIVRVSL